MGKVLKARGIEDTIIEQQCDEVYIKNIEKELIKYIEEEIFPLYSKNEEGHGIKHIKTVIERSLKFAKEYDVNLDIVYTVAAYHDIGHYIYRKKHEITGILTENGKLIIDLNDNDIITMLRLKADKQEPSDYMLNKLEEYLMSISK